MFGVSIDEVAELIADPYSELDTDDNRDAIRRLQTEIAYLSKLQRRILLGNWVYLSALSNGTCLKRKKN